MGEEESVGDIAASNADVWRSTRVAMLGALHRKLESRATSGEDSPAFHVLAAIVERIVEACIRDAPSERITASAVATEIEKMPGPPPPFYWE